MPQKVVTFDNFSGGEYGGLGAQHAPPHSFTGTNVVITQDGSICPRSGLVDLGVTGTAAGAVLGFGYNAFQSRAWYIQGDRVRDFDPGSVGNAARTLTTALSATPSQRVHSVDTENGINTHITSYGDRSYKLDHNAGAVSAHTGSPGGRLCCIYGDRLMVASTSASGNRVQFSAAADFESWPVANYFDLSVGYEILVLAPFRERLVMAKHDGTWWVLSGTPGVNDVLRRMLRSLRPGAPTNGVSRFAMSGDGKVWISAEYGEYPSVFAGSSIETFRHLALGDFTVIANDSGTTPRVGVTGLTKPEDVLYATGPIAGAIDNSGLLFFNGIWTKHHFTQTVSGYIDGRQNYDRVVICDGGGASASPKFYLWSYAIDRPPKSSKTLESIGDASTTPLSASFSLPEWSIKDQSELQVAAVIVDFKKWNHGYSADNNFVLTLTPLHRDGGSAASAGGDGTAVTVGTFTEAASAASSSGTSDRRRWTVPNAAQFTNGFQVSVSSMVGVAIQKIHVIYDARPLQAV